MLYIGLKNKKRTYPKHINVETGKYDTKESQKGPLKLLLKYI